MAKRAGRTRRRVRRVVAGDDVKWTVMIFMVAEHLEGDADLSGEAEDDLEEMRSVAGLQGAASLNVFVQLHSKGSAVREHVGYGPAAPVSASEQDAADGTALLAFVREAFKAAGHRPGTDRAMLVLWGHAYRFAIGHAPVQGGTDALDFAELSDALRQLLATKAGKEHDVLDIVGFDACDLATVEVACELEPFAHYLVASQIGVPLPGWPYDKVLGRLLSPKGPTMSAAELGSYAARQFCAYYASRNPKVSATVSMTLLDLQRASELRAAAGTLAQQIALVMDDEDERDRVMALFIQSQAFEGKAFVDVADLCLNLSRFSGYAGVREAAAALGDILIRPVPPPAGRAREDEPPRPLIVEHARNAHRTARLHGVSLYAPHLVEPSEALIKAKVAYDKFQFVQSTLWGKLVHAFALPGD